MGARTRGEASDAEISCLPRSGRAELQHNYHRMPWTTQHVDRGLRHEISHNGPEFCGQGRKFASALSLGLRGLDQLHHHLASSARNAAGSTGRHPFRRFDFSRKLWITRRARATPRSSLDNVTMSGGVPAGTKADKGHVWRSRATGYHSRQLGHQRTSTARLVTTRSAPAKSGMTSTAPTAASRNVTTGVATTDSRRLPLSGTMVM